MNEDTLPNDPNEMEELDTIPLEKTVPLTDAVRARDAQQYTDRVINPDLTRVHRAAASSYDDSLDDLPAGEVMQPTRRAQPAARPVATAAYRPTPTPPPAAVSSSATPRPPVLSTPSYPVPTAYAPRNNWAFVAIAILTLLATFIFGISAIVGMRLLNDRQGNVSAGEVTPVAQSVTPLPTFDGLTSTPDLNLNIQPWNGSERFTVLLMGLDKRPNETGTAFRTDSMIIVSIDPATRSVGLLSIPRDLYIDIPPNTVAGVNYGLQRVNSAYVIGELACAGCGPLLAVQTVQYNLGIRINDYIVYDFNAVIAGIDAIGGIDIMVERAINDPYYPDMYYGYEPLYIPAGEVHMDGTLALKYARSRHDSSDFDRAKRQQKVIHAIRDRILRLDLFPQLVVQAPGLWGNLNRSIQTGLSLDQLLSLALYCRDIGDDHIKQAVLDGQYVTPTMWDGASVLVPNRATIGPLLVDTFGANYNN